MNQPLPPYTQPPAPPARRRRGGRIALLGCGGLIGLVILIAVIAAVASSQGPTGSTAGGAVSALASPLATRSASPAALSAADQKFVTGLASALAARGQQSTETPAQTAAVGESVCKARRSGVTLAQILAGIPATSAGKLIVRTAEKYLCPAYLPKVLLQLSGSGIQNSAPFLVNSGTVTVKYTYDCSSAGGSGNFIADLEAGNQASLGSDDQSIANALGASGGATTTVYPQDVGAEYHVAVNSECNWSLVVTSG
jgi:hypothetical protein